MDNWMNDYIRAQIMESNRILSIMLDDLALLERVASAASACCTSITNGGKIILAGNGGSASDAQHIASEFVGRFDLERRSIPAIALATDTSIITSISNDYGYHNLFARQLQAYAQKGDVFIAYSTSGSSSNIIAGLREAKSRGVICIGMTGNHCGPMKDLCDHYLDVPCAITPKIQEAHSILGHILCGLVERELFKSHA
jgi:D-sedoheptulose 7-phosphate isomerase